MSIVSRVDARGRTVVTVDGITVTREGARVTVALEGKVVSDSASPSLGRLAPPIGRSAADINARNRLFWANGGP